MSNDEFSDKPSRPFEAESATSPTKETAPATSEVRLGSLAQSARTHHLGSARGTMIFIGILTLGINLFTLATAEQAVNQEFSKEVDRLRQQGQELDMQVVEQLKQDAIQTTRLSGVWFAGLGVVFLILGALVYKFPIPCTVLALVLYLAGQAMSALMDPALVAKGLIVKIVIVVALAKSIQTAIAYSREQSANMPA